jgi:hypothetical protein
MVFSEEGQPLCERCSSSIKIEDLLTPGWEYRGNFDHLAECSNSCAFCSFVWKTSQTHDSRRSPSCFSGKWPSAYMFRTQISGSTVPPSMKLLVTISWPGQDRHEKLAMFTNEKDVLQELYGVPSIGAVGPSTSSGLSFGTAREWLRQCLDCHQHDYGDRLH